jgi:hypothetical protein
MFPHKPQFVLDQRVIDNMNGHGCLLETVENCVFRPIAGSVSNRKTLFLKGSIFIDE